MSMAARFCGATSWQAPITRKPGFFSIKVADVPLTLAPDCRNQGRRTPSWSAAVDGTRSLDPCIYGVVQSPAALAHLMHPGNRLVAFAHALMHDQSLREFESTCGACCLAGFSELCLMANICVGDALARRTNFFGPLRRLQHSSITPRFTPSVPQPRPPHRPDYLGVSCFNDIGLPPLDNATDRIMLCGQPRHAGRAACARPSRRAAFFLEAPQRSRPSS